MSFNPPAEVKSFKYGACLVCGNGRLKDGTCWAFPFHSQEEDVIPTQHQAKPEVEIVSTDTIDATLSVVRPDGTMSEPVPFRVPADVDPETGEMGQMVLGDDPAFVRAPRAKDVPMVKVSFGGTVEMEQSDFEALTDGQELEAGRIAYARVAVYLPNPHTAWVKRKGDKRPTWWENEGRVALKVTELGSLEITERTYCDD